MTTPRDPDRLIHHFLLEGEEQLGDQVFDAVRAEIEQKRQRAFLGPWRLPEMNKIVPIGLGAAAVVVALLVGAQLLGSPNGGLGADPTPIATREPTPTPEGSAEPSSPTDGSLPEGAFVFWDGTPGGSPITVTIPAPGWYGDTPNPVLVKEDTDQPPTGAGMIGFFGELYVYGDPCHWSTTMPDNPATTVDEVVAALTAQASRDASDPVDISVDGYTGKSVTLHVPDDAVFGDCDEDTFASWAARGDPSAGPGRYHQGPGQIDEVWILDVNGNLNVIDAAYYEGTPSEHVDELHAILESMSFGE